MDLLEEIKTITENHIQIKDGIEAVEKLAELRIGLRIMRDDFLEAGISEDSNVIARIDLLIDKTR